MKFVQSVAVSQRIGHFKLKKALRYLTRFEGLKEFVSPPVSVEAVLEDPEVGGATLSGTWKILDDAREDWNEM